MSARPERARTAGSGEEDALQRFVFERARVRGELVRLDDTWREVRRRLFHDEELRLVESMPVRFACRRSRDRVAGRPLGEHATARRMTGLQGSVPKRSVAAENEQIQDLTPFF